jgi:hypothetical protein
MSVKPAKKLAIVQRRQRVAELYLQGWQQEAIAAELAIRQPMVSEDLAKIRQAWRESAIRDFDAARDLELARLDRIEREAWAAWERSKQPSQSATVNGEAGSQTAKRTVKHQNGDPRFLDIALRCNEARRQILGIDSPLKLAETTPDGQPLTREERLIHIQAILREQLGVAALLPGETEASDEGRPGAEAAGVDDGRGADPAQPAFALGHPSPPAASPAS